MDEAPEGGIEQEVVDTKGADDIKQPEDEAVDVSSFSNDDAAIIDIINSSGAIRTLDGEIAGDEFASDAVNYRILLNKIDKLLDRLKLDA